MHKRVSILLIAILIALSALIWTDTSVAEERGIYDAWCKTDTNGERRAALSMEGLISLVKAENNEQWNRLGIALILLGGIAVIISLILFLRKGKKSAKSNGESTAVALPPNGSPDGPNQDKRDGEEKAASERGNEDAIWMLKCSLDGKVYPIHGQLRIGRGKGNDIAYPESDLSISRNHCRIWTENRRLFIIDTSENGIYLQRVQRRLPKNVQVELYSGDILFMAGWKNRIDIRSKQ